MGRVMEAVKVAVWRSYWWVGVICAVMLVVTTAPVSRLAINPVSAQITGDVVQVQRHFPGDTFGLRRPLISYVETVKGFSPQTNSGHVCKDMAGPFRYSEAKTIGQWSMPWAAECLADPDGYVWEACWTWHLGMIRFGAVCMSRTHITQEIQIGRIETRLERIEGR